MIVDLGKVSIYVKPGKTDMNFRKIAAAAFLRSTTNFCSICRERTVTQSSKLRCMVMNKVPFLRKFMREIHDSLPDKLAPE